LGLRKEIKALNHRVHRDHRENPGFGFMKSDKSLAHRVYGYRGKGVWGYRGLHPSLDGRGRGRVILHKQIKALLAEYAGF